MANLKVKKQLHVLVAQHRTMSACFPAGATGVGRAVCAGGSAATQPAAGCTQTKQTQQERVGWENA